MEFFSMVRSLLTITAVVSLGLSGLSFFSYIKMKRVPKKDRNLLEYGKIRQYLSFGFGTLAVSLTLFTMLYLLR